MHNRKSVGIYRNDRLCSYRINILWLTSPKLVVTKPVPWQIKQGSALLLPVSCIPRALIKTCCHFPTTGRFQLWHHTPQFYLPDMSTNKALLTRTLEDRIPPPPPPLLASYMVNRMKQKRLDMFMWGMVKENDAVVARFVSSESLVQSAHAGPSWMLMFRQHMLVHHGC